MVRLFWSPELAAVSHTNDLFSLGVECYACLLGIGFQTALVLASRGARVILADKVDGTKAKKKIIEKTHNTNIVTKYLDLASLSSVRRFAKDINSTEERLDILINNAGVGTVGNKYTDDGLHPTMQINHLGPFLLTHLLTGKVYLKNKTVEKRENFQWCFTLVSVKLETVLTVAYFVRFCFL